MAKDPAFLFYYQDFLVGTDELTNEETGAYIRCLCHQAHKGYITEKHMKNICKTQDIQNIIKSKFIFNSEVNGYENQRLKIEIEKRKKYSESRSNNRKGKTKTIENEKKICKTYDNHMENENENENKDIKQGENKFDFLYSFIADGIPSDFKLEPEAKKEYANLIWKEFLINSQSWIETTCMLRKISDVNYFKIELDEFLKTQIQKDTYFKGYNKLKDHFINYLNKKEKSLC